MSEPSKYKLKKLREWRAAAVEFAAGKMDLLRYTEVTEKTARYLLQIDAFPRNYSGLNESYEHLKGKLGAIVGATALSHDDIKIFAKKIEAGPEGLAAIENNMLTYTDLYRQDHLIRKLVSWSDWLINEQLKTSGLEALPDGNCRNRLLEMCKQRKLSTKSLVPENV